MENRTFTFEQVENLNKIILDMQSTEYPIHNRISNFFNEFMNFVPFDRASVLLFHKDGNGKYRKETSTTINWNLDYIAKYDAEAISVVDDTLKPLDTPNPTVIKSSSYFNQEEREKTRFWTEYMLPNDAYYEAVANLQVDFSKKTRANVSFTRNFGSGDFSNEDVRLIRIIQPHLSKMVKHYIDERDKGEELVATQSYNCIGYCMLDKNCQLVKSNKKFDELNKDSENKLLNKIIHLSVSFDNYSDASRPLSFEYKLEDAPLFLELTRTPLTMDNRGYEYCCLVYNLSYFFMSALKQAKLTYELSDREYDILTCIVQGYKQDEIAQRLYLSVSSVKKYVAAVYDKMNITNQKQIFTKLNLL